MPTPLRSSSSIYASRLFSRRRLDVRARLVAQQTTGERIIVQARTFDVSRTGAGLTLTRELPSGTEVLLYLRLPGSGAAHPGFRATRATAAALVSRQKRMRICLQARSTR